MNESISAVRETPVERLSEAEEAAWIDAVMSHKTADTSSVAEVIKFARYNMDPDKFRLGDVGIVYRENLRPSVSIRFCPYPKWQQFDDCYECATDYGVVTAGHDIIVNMYEYNKIKDPYNDYAEEIETFCALEKGCREFVKRAEYLHDWYRKLIE